MNIMKGHMKRNLVIILVVLGLIGLTVSLTVGGSEQDEVLAQEGQTTTVQRGNLSLDITAAGNLDLSRTEDLIFDLFYQEGTVAEVSVEGGDSVTEGQALASLDASEWEEEIENLEDALTTAQRQVTTKERALDTAERNLTTKERALAAAERNVTAKEEAVVKAERNVTTKELAVRQAELDVDTATYNLEKIAEVKVVQDRIDNLEYIIDFATSMAAGEFGGGGANYAYWINLRTQAQAELAQAQADKQDILTGNSITISTTVALQVAQAQLQIEQAQRAVEDAQVAVDEARTAVEDARIAVEDAKIAVDNARKDLENAKVDVSYAQADVEIAKQNAEDAQKDLDDARAASREIIAPFDGFVTNVNVEGGDEVVKGTVAIQLADPDKFEADILVSEMDISQVKLGGEAQVSVDAMSGVSLPATVTHIAPTATIQSGVVNYTVTVEVESIPEDVYLKEGMTVTVSLIVAEQQNVLLVPYAAITTEGGQKYVQVVSPDGTTEKRAITTGITDYQFTEVTEGLSEGEQVLISGAITTASESTSAEQQQPGGGMMIPGMGGGPPGGQ
jgi:HlyD family secretion protein